MLAIVFYRATSQKIQTRTLDYSIIYCLPLNCTEGCAISAQLDGFHAMKCLCILFARFKIDMEIFVFIAVSILDTWTYIYQCKKIHFRGGRISGLRNHLEIVESAKCKEDILIWNRFRHFSMFRSYMWQMRTHNFSYYQLLS